MIDKSTTIFLLRFPSSTESYQSLNVSRSLVSSFLARSRVSRSRVSTLSKQTPFWSFSSCCPYKIVLSSPAWRPFFRLQTQHFSWETSSQWWRWDKKSLWFWKCHQWIITRRLDPTLWRPDEVRWSLCWKQMERRRSREGEVFSWGVGSLKQRLQRWRFFSPCVGDN